MIRVIKYIKDLFDAPTPSSGTALGWDANGEITNLPILPEAPADNNIYVRKNTAWEGASSLPYIGGGDATDDYEVCEVLIMGIPVVPPIVYAGVVGYDETGTVATGLYYNLLVIDGALSAQELPPDQEGSLTIPGYTSSGGLLSATGKNYDIYFSDTYIAAIELGIGQTRTSDILVGYDGGGVPTGLTYKAVVLGDTLGVQEV